MQRPESRAPTTPSIAGSARWSPTSAPLSRSSTIGIFPRYSHTGPRNCQTVPASSFLFDIWYPCSQLRLLFLCPFFLFSRRLVSQLCYSQQRADQCLNRTQILALDIAPIAESLARNLRAGVGESEESTLQFAARLTNDKTERYTSTGNDMQAYRY